MNPKLSSTVSVVKISDNILEFFKTNTRQQLHIKVQNDMIMNIVLGLDGSKEKEQIAKENDVNIDDLNALLYYFKETNQDCIVRLVSRLDMDTSGLIIIAKNQYAHMELSNDMQKNEIEKRYLTLVHGHMEAMEGTIDKPIYS